eukprot:TRINITY_DN28159_c0_g1_i1.p1 TRINITY_DN28159_c0_g1~~TRINITY_DN28159_c0_g1_i1.p1  ORF type:complete len:1113 (+),score=155.22 TRINITY_DN28159_c0_g1_i1:83-3340(+)
MRVSRTIVPWDPAPPLVASNVVRTAKYTPWNFIPKNLFEQFHRAANWYFVVVIVLNVLPWLEVFQPELCSVPLIAMLSATAIKDAAEDWVRWKQDAKQNNTSTLLRTKRGELDQAQWREADVGCVVRVVRDRGVPADVLLLATSAEGGECFIDTATLDGESSLKPRYAVSELPAGGITCGPPDARLDHFDVHAPARGASQEEEAEVWRAGASHIVLRGSVLRNTAWADGLVLYAGMETKELLNSSRPAVKRSQMERLMNSAIVVLCVLLTAMSLACGAGAAIASQQQLYPAPERVGYGPFAEGLRGVAMAVILFQVMVPIALYVSLEVLRACWGWLVGQAAEMTGDDGKRAQVRNVATCEELGCVTHTLADKTGTLTENRMEFRVAHCCSGAPVLSGAPHLLWLAAAACGTVRPGIEGTFEGESPDEVALAKAAAQQGHPLTHRGRHKGSEMEEVTVAGQSYLVAATLPYSSERRRMGVVLQCVDGRTVLLLKGAEDAVAQRCKADARLKEALGACRHHARCGLRTLLFAAKVLRGGAGLADWVARGSGAAAAGTEHEDRWWAEHEFDLAACGATGVEDLLQPGVEDTVRSLVCAGISVAMATGDRPDTAEHIARRCGLVPHGAPPLRRVHSIQDLQRLTHVECAIIAGEHLTMCLEDPAARSALGAALRRPAPACCLLCRASPAQKAAAVGLLRGGAEGSGVVMAVGDGGNDASMLRAAACGVAIRGVEGRGAVLASDVAIGRFRHLKVLLLIHGRWSLARAGGLIRYGLQKNVCFAFVLFVYQPICGWSLASLMDAWTLLLYNIYTAAPSLFAFALEQDCPREGLVDTPVLYLETQRFGPFNMSRFSKEVAEAAWHAIVLTFVPLLGLGGLEGDAWGLASSQWAVGAVQSCCLAVTQSAALLRELRYIPGLVGQSIIGVCVMHFGVLLLLQSAISIEPQYQAGLTALVTPGAWLCIGLSAVASLLPSLAAQVWRECFTPSLSVSVRARTLREARAAPFDEGADIRPARRSSDGRRSSLQESARRLSTSLKRAMHTSEPVALAWPTPACSSQEDEASPVRQLAEAAPVDELLTPDGGRPTEHSP